MTVSPGPVADYLEGENATLLCHVSQKRWGNSLLAVRWFFGRPNSKVGLMVRRSKHGAVKYYGRFHNSSYQQRLRLREQRQGRLHNYTLSVLTLRPADQGLYVCKVQEIIQQRKRWTVLSNSSSETELRGEHARPLGRFGNRSTVRTVGQVGPRGLCWPISASGPCHRSQAGARAGLSVDAGLSCIVGEEARAGRSQSLGPC